MFRLANVPSSRPLTIFGPRTLGSELRLPCSCYVLLEFDGVVKRFPNMDATWRTGGVINTRGGARLTRTTRSERRFDCSFTPDMAKGIASSARMPLSIR